MRRFFLILLFASYYMLLPFVMNCGGKDLPYVVENQDSQDAAANDNTLQNCQAQEFLTADCVAVILQAQEQLAADEATIRDGWNLLDVFAACQGTFDATSCNTTVENFLDAYQICSTNDSAAAANQSAYCIDIKDALEEAADQCDAALSGVSAGFCAVLG